MLTNSLFLKENPEGCASDDLGHMYFNKSSVHLSISHTVIYNFALL